MESAGANEAGRPRDDLLFHFLRLTEQDDPEAKHGAKVAVAVAGGSVARPVAEAEQAGEAGEGTAGNVAKPVAKAERDVEAEDVVGAAGGRCAKSRLRSPQWPQSPWPSKTGKPGTVVEAAGGSEANPVAVSAQDGETANVAGGNEAAPFAEAVQGEDADAVSDAAGTDVANPAAEAARSSTILLIVEQRSSKRRPAAALLWPFLSSSALRSVSS